MNEKKKEVTINLYELLFMMDEAELLVAILGKYCDFMGGAGTPVLEADIYNKNIIRKITIEYHPHTQDFVDLINAFNKFYKGRYKIISYELYSNKDGNYITKDETYKIIKASIKKRRKNK